MLATSSASPRRFERDALDDLRPHLVGELAAGDVGLDQAGRHAVDADAVRPEFARHRLGEAEHAGLGGGVMRAAEDAAAALGGDRGHAGDRALLARPHMRDEGLAQVEHAAQVHVDDALPVLGRDLHDLDAAG